MIAITKPVLTAEEVFTECVDIIQDEDLQSRLKACKPLVIASEEEFEQKITKGEIFTISRESVVNGNVKAAELKKVYTAQMVQRSRGRVFYDKLLLAAPKGLCPLCAHRDASTLDHYLPKTLYPRLSVVPVNLIPACKDCNKDKDADYPTADFEETIHPYYDNLSRGFWLKCKVVQSKPISMAFFVERHEDWDELLFKRVKYHFKSFNLGQLYSVQAARELSNMKYQLQQYFNEGAVIKNFLADNANSRSAVNPNSWQAAFYRGLAEDEWFYTGGFQNIE